MIKIYRITYNYYEAETTFKVDTEKFTEEIAKQTLDFYSWEYNKNNNPIDEALKKYAIQAIKFATYNDYNTLGVIREFEDTEGFANVDGSMGIQLIDVEPYEFDEDNLDITIENKSE